MSDSHPPPAGWYPDPAGQGMRYWDGGRWTQQTQAVPTPAAPVAPAPQRAATPNVPPPPHPPTPPMAGGHPGAVATGPPAGSIGATFLADLQRFDGFAVLVTAAAVFVLSTFLPWVNISLLGASDSVNAWSAEASWLVRGFSAEEWRVGVASGVAITGGTDLIVLLPLALVAVGLALVAKRGTSVAHGAEITVGAAGLLTVLLIGEALHVNSWFGDLRSAIIDAGGSAEVEGGVSFGLWLAIVAGAMMTFGAVRTLLAARAR